MRRVALRSILIKLARGYTDGVLEIAYLRKPQINCKEDTGGEQKSWKPKCAP